MHVNLQRNCFADFCFNKHQKYHKESVTKFCHGFRMILNDGLQILYDMLQILYGTIAYTTNHSFIEINYQLLMSLMYKAGLNKENTYGSVYKSLFYQSD